MNITIPPGMSKTLVTAIMAVIMIIDAHYGWNIAGSEDLTLAIIALIGVVLSWFVPN